MNQNNFQKSGSSYGGSSYYGSEYADQMMDEIDDATQEMFYGEWKNDKRNGKVWGFGLHPKLVRGEKEVVKLSRVKHGRGETRSG